MPKKSRKRLQKPAAGRTSGITPADVDEGDPGDVPRFPTYDPLGRKQVAFLSILGADEDEQWRQLRIEICREFGEPILSEDRLPASQPRYLSYVVDGHRYVESLNCGFHVRQVLEGCEPANHNEWIISFDPTKSKQQRLKALLRWFARTQKDSLNWKKKPGPILFRLAVFRLARAGYDSRKISDLLMPFDRKRAINVRLPAEVGRAIRDLIAEYPELAKK